MRIAHATELARSRRFLEAEALLSPSGRLPETVIELDLLARILAQQHRFREARRCWDAALQVDPLNEAYRNGIKRLEQVERLRKLRWKVTLIGGVTLIMATLVVVAVMFWPSRSQVTPKQQIQRVQPSAPIPSQPKPQAAPTPSPPKPTQPPPTPQKR